MSDFCYIYCITRENPDTACPKVSGHQGGEIVKIPYRQIAAFISKTSQSYFEPTFENLSRHEEVISFFMKEGSPLPMRFSTILSSEEKIKAMLETYYDQFMENLEKVEGKVELGVKVFCKLEIQEEKAAMPETSSPREYMLARYCQYQSRQRQTEGIMKETERLHDRLAALSCESSYTRPMKNNLFFNASYLVAKDQKEAFDREAEHLKKQYPAFKIVYSGPWPAYHFVTISKEDENEQLC
ncbi:hypothetical protein SDC9_89167 [bioreactor metagenome]|uniref:Gas vesicle synthesis protein GvpL/GvpF n=1 Tax=bioreactor metagenome TaxID=1076179 RepID=A0A644ZNT8_9ZZZZ